MIRGREVGMLAGPARKVERRVFCSGVVWGNLVGLLSLVEIEVGG